MKLTDENNFRSYKKIGELLKQDIISGKYKTGERLPPERDIAEFFGVSRTVIREALIMLELEELVTVKKGSGIYVREFVADKEQAVSELLSRDIGPFELLQARQLIESGIAEFAAMQVTRNDIMALKEILQRERNILEQEKDDYFEDQKFHFMIAKITQNEVLIRLQQELWNYRTNSSMWKGLHSHISNFTYRKLWITDHENILNALQRKDPIAAKKAMWQHLENVKQTLFELSDIDDPEFDGYLFNTSPIVIEN